MASFLALRPTPKVPYHCRVFMPTPERHPGFASKIQQAPVWVSHRELARTFLNPNLSRSRRYLRRHGVSNLRALQKERESIEGSPESTTRQFKAYEPGFLHIDVKYLPQMPDEEKRRYLFVAIDRATRFLANVLANAPFVVRTVLTDDGKEFSDRFSSAGERQITGRHPFDRLRGEKRIAHRLIQPRHPQTNGMVERFNGRIAEILRA